MLSSKNNISFRLLVDDAHGFGTLGKTGAGAWRRARLPKTKLMCTSLLLLNLWLVSVHLSLETKEIIRYLKFNLRSQIFAKSLTMPMVIGGLKRLELLRTRPEIKAKLWENVEKLRKWFTGKRFQPWKF